MPQKLTDSPERLLGRNDEDTDKSLTPKGLVAEQEFKLRPGCVES